MSLSRYSGFAEGFRDGFGLMSNVLDRRANQELAEQDAQLQGERQAWEQDANNPTNKLIEGQAANQLATAEWRSQQTQDLKRSQQAAQQKQTQIDSNAAAAIAAQNFINVAEQVKTGARMLDDRSLTEMESLFRQTNNSLLSLSDAIDPSNRYQALQLGQVLQNVEQGNFDAVDTGVIANVLNTVLRSNNTAGVGEEVRSDSHPYAKEFADKGFMVKSKSVSPNMSVQNGGIALNVDVLIEHPDTGETFVYEAPMTVSREGGTDPTELSFDEAIQASAGYFQFANAISPYKDIVTQLLGRQYEANHGKGKLDLDVNAAIENYKRQTADDPNGNSPIEGMSNAEFRSKTATMQQYFRLALTDPSRLDPKPSRLGDDRYHLMADSSPIRSIEKMQQGKRLSRAQVLRAAQYLNEKDGVVTIDPQMKNEWNQFKNGILGRRQTGLTTSTPKLPSGIQ